MRHFCATFSCVKHLLCLVIHLSKWPPGSVGRPKHVRVMAGALEGDTFIGSKAEVRWSWASVARLKCGRELVIVLYILYFSAKIFIKAYSEQECFLKTIIIRKKCFMGFWQLIIQVVFLFYIFCVVDLRFCSL